MEEDRFNEFVETMKSLFRRYDLQVTGRLTIRDNTSEIPIDFNNWNFIRSRTNDFMLFIDRSTGEKS